MPYANNNGADQPVHPRSLISTFVVCCLDSIIPLVSISEISNLYIASVAVQACLSRTWSQTPKTGFLMTRLKWCLTKTGRMHVLFGTRRLADWCLSWTAGQWHEPPSDKTNKIICAPSKGSDQPEHLPSLISVFAVRMKKAWVFSYPLCAQQRLWSDWADPPADLSLDWAQSFCWFCHEAAHI